MVITGDITDAEMVFTLDLMSSQISQVDLLMAMYPSADELIIDDSTRQLLSRLRRWCDGEDQLPSHVPDNLFFTLNIMVEEVESESRSLPLTVSVSLRHSKGVSKDVSPIVVRVRQPDWLGKVEIAEINAKLPTDDVFSAIDTAREAARGHTRPAERPLLTEDILQGPITRVWFYFPSLSTREKRDDLVSHAPEYDLTGFVLAGKPGILCLEGISGDIDAYMKFIKTESWGDIPAYQKKVSERYREEGDHIVRVFKDMQEITDSLGEKRGERANRGDMKAFEAWLRERGFVSQGLALYRAR